MLDLLINQIKINVKYMQKTKKKTQLRKGSQLTPLVRNHHWKKLKKKLWIMKIAKRLIIMCFKKTSQSHEQ